MLGTGKVLRIPSWSSYALPEDHCWKRDVDHHPLPVGLNDSLPFKGKLRRSCHSHGNFLCRDEALFLPRGCLLERATIPVTFFDAEKLFAVSKQTNAASPHPDRSQWKRFLAHCCPTTLFMSLLRSGGVISN